MDLELKKTCKNVKHTIKWLLMQDLEKHKKG